MIYKLVLTIDHLIGIIKCMDTISISQLKINPSKIIAQAADYPVAVGKRNKIQAYLISKNLYDKIVAYIEALIDKKAVDEADFTKGRDIEEVAEEMNLWKSSSP